MLMLVEAVQTALLARRIVFSLFQNSPHVVASEVGSRVPKLQNKAIVSKKIETSLFGVAVSDL